MIHERFRAIRDIRVRRDRLHKLEEALYGGGPEAPGAPWRITDFLELDHRDPLRVIALDRVAGYYSDPESQEQRRVEPVPYKVRLRTVDGLPLRLKIGHRYLDRTGIELAAYARRGAELYDYRILPGECVVDAHLATQALQLYGVGLAVRDVDLRKTDIWRLRARVVEVSARAWREGEEEPPRDAESEAKLVLTAEWRAQLDKHGSQVLLGLPGWAAKPREEPTQLSLDEFDRVAATIRGTGTDGPPASTPKARRARKTAAAAGG